jgi:hypothetical protein
MRTKGLRLELGPDSFSCNYLFSFYVPPKMPYSALLVVRVKILAVANIRLNPRHGNRDCAADRQAYAGIFSQ